MDAELNKLGEYPVNFYKAKKDKNFLGSLSHKKPFAYYLMQTQIPDRKNAEGNLESSYSPKKDKEFLSYLSRKNPFAYYLMQTQIPNEVLKEDSLFTRLGRVFTGSMSRKKDPTTGELSNQFYGVHLPPTPISPKQPITAPKPSTYNRIENLRKDLKNSKIYQIKSTARNIYGKAQNIYNKVQNFSQKHDVPGRIQRFSDLSTAGIKNLPNTIQGISNRVKNLNISNRFNNLRGRS